MKVLKTIATSILLLAGLALYAQQPRIQTTTAPMSEKIIRQRLQILGYSNIQINKTNTLRYEIHATKAGQPVVLNFHPQTGAIHESAPGRPPARVWTMPVEPTENIRMERMPPH